MCVFEASCGCQPEQKFPAWSSPGDQQIQSFCPAFVRHCCAAAFRCRTTHGFGAGPLAISGNLAVIVTREEWTGADMTCLILDIRNDKDDRQSK